jgi:rod shape-determining protein MreC
MKIAIKSRFTIIAAIIIIIVLVVLLQKMNFLSPVKDVTTTVFSPIQSFFREAANRIKNIDLYFKNNKRVFSENEELRRQLADLTAENLTLKNKISDIEMLNTELDYIKSHNLESVPARVIGFSSDNASQILIINQGRNAGIQIGYPAIAYEGVLMGKVVEANSNVSKIMLLNDNHSQIGAVVQNDEKSPGVVNGQYGLSLKMELIPQDQKISLDQLVTTSGLEQNIPADLIIGKITSVSKKEGELFQQASLEPSAQYLNIDVVSVIIPSI